MQASKTRIIGYVAVVSLVGTVCAVAGALQMTRDSMQAYLVWGGLLAASALLRVPSIDRTYIQEQAASFQILAVLTLGGLPAAPLIYVTMAVSYGLIHKAVWYKALFNASQFTLSALAGWWAWSLLMGAGPIAVSDLLHVVLDSPLGVAAWLFNVAVHVGINILLVFSIISMTTKTPLKAGIKNRLRNNHQTGDIYATFLLPLVIVLILNSHPMTWALAGLVMAGEYLNYKKYLEKLRWSRETQKVEQTTAKEAFSDTWRAKFDAQFRLLRRLTAEMEEEKAQYPQDVDELESIVENIDRIEDLVHRLEGKAETRPADVFPINAFIERTIKSVRIQDRYDGVKISFIPAASRPRVEAHPARLQQVLVNLLNNAADAVRGNEPGDRNITVRAEAAGDRLRISVADQGGGIPEEVLPRIFEEQFTTKLDGHGFGLAACRQIVDEYSWSLTARNEDQGAHLLLELPKAA